MDASGLADQRIVILTADHCAMDGAHQLHAKGAVAYCEQHNVPFIVSRPRASRHLDVSLRSLQRRRARSPARSAAQHGTHAFEPTGRSAGAGANRASGRLRF
ncbi:hypothetical protein QTI66_32440 [Variovorax sp. J22R133]|uniref:hypothetical protein n=1 Tax=Variovorax brevis TaxID=3053503 RepID=UPI002576CD69|nr:hypothetical protein [Variovorax sp. J22R133]MDM0116839.1 hypothetical protein [Variovorax sp. J22R133]